MNYINKKLNGNRKGFTLIELIVVIAIIGILVLLAGPKFMGYTTQAKEAQRANDIKVVEYALAMEMVRNDEIDGIPFSMEDMNTAISEGKVYTINGLVTEAATVNFTNITDSKVVKNTNTTLEGNFVADPEGSVYYIDIEGSDVAETPEEPEASVCVTNDDGTNYAFDPATGTITDYLGSEMDVVIPCYINGVEVVIIGEDAFYNKGLTSVVISDTVTTINSWSFDNNNLTSVTIGNSVAFIGKDSFMNNNLASITIPGSVTTIEKGAFYGNANIMLTVNSDNSNYMSYSGALYTKDGSTLISGNQNNSNDMLDGVTTIGDYAFYRQGLTSVTMPNSVITIGEGAFSENNITSVIMSNNLVTIGNGAFSLNYSLASINIPDSVTTIGNYAFEENNLTTITLSNNLTSVGYDAFSFNGPDYRSNSIPTVGPWVGTWTVVDRIWELQ